MREFRDKHIIILVLVVALTSCMQEKPKILIVGDSISLGYTPFVQKNLKNIADVSHNQGNARDTGTGLENIEAWIANNKWDIIQFNWGLWDLSYINPNSKEQFNMDKINGKVTFNVHDYGHNLESIIKLIRKKSDAKLIFVTTSFVPENAAGRFKEDAIRYNQMAEKIMIDNDVIINDIYEISIKIHSQYGLKPDNVHYLPEGYKELGLQISDFLKSEIR